MCLALKVFAFTNWCAYLFWKKCVNSLAVWLGYLYLPLKLSNQSLTNQMKKVLTLLSMFAVLSLAACNNAEHTDADHVDSTATTVENTTVNNTTENTTVTTAPADTTTVTTTPDAGATVTTPAGSATIQH
jgi:hypothetical protein